MPRKKRLDNNLGPTQIISSYLRDQKQMKKLNTIIILLS